MRENFDGDEKAAAEFIGDACAGTHGEEAQTIACGWMSANTANTDDLSAVELANLILADIAAAQADGGDDS